VPLAARWTTAYDTLVLRRLFSIAIAATLIASSPSPVQAKTHDGAHDFDFNNGSWHTNIRRLVSGTWVPYHGTVTVRPALDGKMSVEEIEADGRGHLEFLNVRTYNPQSHKWSLNGAAGSDGTLDAPLLGDFSSGSGVFTGFQTWSGHKVLVRQTFYGITANSYKFVEEYSSDNGTTWKPNFKASLTRTAATAPSEGSQSVADTSHDFDFNYATWRTHIKAADEAKNGKVSWDPMQGTVTMRKVWNGRGLLEELRVGSGSNGFQGVTLYLYDPQTRQWSQTYADSSDGVFEPSMTGAFHNGTADLVGPGIQDGKKVLMRDAWSKITPTSHHFQIDYSSDGGKTWQPTFIADLTRIGPGI